MGMDYVPGETFLHKLHPLDKLIFVFVPMCMVMMTDDPIVLFLVFLSLVLFFHLAKIPGERLVELMKIALPAAVFYVIIGMAVFQLKPGDTLFFYLIPPLKLVPVTLESLVFQLGVALKFLIVIIGVRFVLLITRVTDIVRTLYMIKVPSFVATAISCSFAMMPVMYNEAKAIEEAQKSRALRIEYPDPIRKARAYMALITPLLSLSIQRSMNLAVAIESRGFGYAAKNRTFLRDPRFRKSDWIFLIALIAFMAVFTYLGEWGIRWPPLTYTFAVDLVKRFLK